MKPIMKKPNGLSVKKLFSICKVKKRSVCNDMQTGLLFFRLTKIREKCIISDILLIIKKLYAYDT